MPRPVLAVLAVVLLLPPQARPAWAREEPLQAEPADRAAIAACLKLVADNAKAGAERPTEDGKPGPKGRLAAAAHDAATDPTSCIGAVSSPCQQQPGGYSTAGMITCIGREWAVWDERLNRAYRFTLQDGSKTAADKKLSDAMRATQRAWLKWREERCKLPAIENEGGSIVGPLYGACMSETTARQALWLEERLDPEALR